MKKKEWYGLINQYNDIVQQRKYNAVFVDEDSFSEIKRTITDYIEKAGKFMEAEVMALSHNYKKMGLRADCAKANIENSWYAKWAYKADNIFQAVQHEEEIDAEDIEGSFYEMRWYGGRFSTMQVILILGILFLLALSLTFLG